MMDSSGEMKQQDGMEGEMKHQDGMDCLPQVSATIQEAV
jgi:hypothetical protein